MQEYDTILKRVLTRSTPAASLRIIGFEARRWLNVELPPLRSLRVDLLGEDPAGRLFHVELQSANDPAMARRMLQYAVAIHERYGRRPGQIVLYTGEAPLRMTGQFSEFGYECRIADIRGIDAAPLLQSTELADNVIAVLLRHRNRRAAVRLILRRIADAPAQERAIALSEVFILAGLRKLGPLVEEAESMPILNDIMDHEVLGPKLRKARAEGERAGREDGIERGERQILTRMIEKRFGRIPVWAAKSLDAMTPGQLEATALRLLDAATIKELLGR
jgi:predicted transposase YdaD